MKNRFYQTPHCTSFGTDFPFAQAAFREMKAEGGWAVVNVEYCSIHPESDDRPHIGARLWDHADVRNLALTCEKIHSHGALAGVELHFGASHGTNHETRLPARGVSQLPDPAAWMHSCYEMDKREIRELQDFYVRAAQRALAAGFDIVNIHGSEVGSIPLHFLMGYFNKRTDEYGGSLENRARFWRETIERVREAVGDDCAIAVRMCIDTQDDSADGIRVEEEGVGFISIVDHLVDVWDIQVGGWNSSRWGEDARSSRFVGENFQAPWAERVRPYTEKPIVGVGRFTNPDTMVQVITRGHLDIIGSARSSIADPFLPKKIREGRLDEIRECIGCNICASRFNLGVPIICTQNATSGEEYRRRWHPESFSRAKNADNDVLIVGAGPAGMECAVVLGKRGMRRIHLVDRADEIGGIMRWIPRLPGLGEWGRVIDYRKIQLDKLKNVEVLVRTALNAELIRDYGAELVIIATGSYWAKNGLNGVTRAAIPGADADFPHCVTPEQIMVEGKELPGGRALVYDCEGYFMGVSLAERLANEGKETIFVTPLPSVAPYMSFTGEGFELYRKLSELNVDLVTSHVIDGIQGGSISGHHSLNADQRAEWDVDTVVLVTQRLSDDGLYRELSAEREALSDNGIDLLIRIGDCVVPRLIADSIFDGHRLGREIDTSDPTTPLPFIREIPAAGASSMHRLLGEN